MHHARLTTSLAALALAFGLAACAPTPEPTVTVTAEPPAATEPSAPQTHAPSEVPTEAPTGVGTEASPTPDEAVTDDTPVPGEEPSSAFLARAVETARAAGYDCAAAEPSESFIDEVFDCTKGSDTLTVVEYDSPANRGPHIRTWAPRPNRPVGERWLIASDNPRDIDPVAEAMMRHR